MDSQIISSTVILVYLLGAFTQGLKLFGKLPQVNWAVFILSVVALFGHGLLLYTWIETAQGQNLDAWLMFSLTTWLMGLMIFFTFKSPSQDLIPLVFPFASLSLFCVIFFSGTDIVVTKAHPGVLIHIFISIIAVSVLFLASLQASLFSLQNHWLKIRYKSPLLRLIPPLETMEKLLLNIIWVGLILLTFSLVTGLIFIGEMFSPKLLPKTLLSILAWGLLASLLIGRYSLGWRGNTIVRWTLGGVLLLFFAYFGTKLAL